MTIAIIRDSDPAKAGKKLNELVSKTISSGKAYHKLLDEAAINVVYHAAVFGQCQPMTTLYNSLTSNTQQAFKQFVRRINIYIGIGEPHITDGKSKDELNAAAELGKVFGFADKSFNVVSVKTDAKAKEKRTAAAQLMDLFADANEDPRYTSFFKRNNFQDIRNIGDAQALEQLKRVLANANKESEEGKVKNTVSPKMKEAIEHAITTAEQIVDMDDRVDPSEVIANMAQVARETKSNKAEKPEVSTH